MDWLAKRPVTWSTVTGTIDTPSDCHVAEYILYRRRDPFIDLGLARHGRSRSVLVRLYDKRDNNLRVVLAGNGSLFTGDEHAYGFWLPSRPAHRSIVSEILANGPLPVLRALVTNPDLPSNYYASMIEDYFKAPRDDSERPEAPSPAFSNERFRFIVKHLGENPRVSVPREESHERFYLDGYADYDFNRFPVAAWGLAAEAPVTPDWAEALASLYRKLHKPYDCLQNVDSVIDRWNVKVERYSADHFREVRAALAANFLKPNLDLLRSGDPARRDAFFRTFDPNSREFADLDWNEFTALDRNWGLTVYHNLKVWASPIARRRYREVLWASTAGDNDITPIGFWDEKAEALEREHPEWFIEPQDASHPVARSEQIDDLRTEVRQLISSLTERANSKLLTAGVFIAGLIVGLLF
jgi:hypothetical protein